MLADYFGLHYDKVMAFVDQVNDLVMIEYAGISVGVAMGNECYR
ncbi:MAG: HAD hydrolase family protein [Sodalis sp. (in: enterobacteria)]